MAYPAKALVMGGVILVVCIVAGSWGVSVTSRDKFCLSCHEMQVYKDELRLSSHAVDIKGKEIGCSQCHIPADGLFRMLGAKVWLGLKDLWVHNTEQDLHLNRAAMQASARRFTADANCQACHEDMYKDARGEKAISQEGKLAHDNYLGKNGQARSGCVGCHQNLAHLPAFDARLPRNHAFAQKLKENRQ